MKRFLCLFLCILFLFPFVFVFAFAADWDSSNPLYDSSNMRMQRLTADQLEIQKFTDDLGGTYSDITVGPEQYYYFQLWEGRSPSGQWVDYIGEFWNESREFQSPMLAGRVRPFGNTDLNIGGITSGNETPSGFYLNRDTIGSRGTVTFNFGFYLVDVQKTGNMLPPVDVINGYFYLFYFESHLADVNKDGQEEFHFSYQKRGYPVTYSYEYFPKTYTAAFTCSLEIELDSSDWFGLVPLFTFHDLTTEGFINKVYFPFFEIHYSLTYQQQLLYELEKLQNGKLNPDNFDPRNLVSGSSKLSSSITDALTDFSKHLDTVHKSSSSAVSDHMNGLIVVSTIMTQFMNNKYISSLLYVSLGFTVFIVLLNLSTDIKHSGRRRQKRSGSKGG